MNTSYASSPAHTGTIKKIYFQIKPLLYLRNENKTDHFPDDISGGTFTGQV